MDYSVRRASSSQRSVDAIIVCTSESRPLASISWFSNDTELNNNTRFQIHHSLLHKDTLRSSILVISNTSAIDDGNYTCLAKTRIGNDSATITFSYSGKYFTTGPRHIYVKGSCPIVAMTYCLVQCYAIDNPI